MASTTQEDVEQIIEDIFNTGGVEAVQKFVAEDRSSWKKEHVKIGVTGRRGVGKSSFINAYRGIKYDDEEGAAKVGVTQTTMKATPYPDPNNRNIVLYDLPGVGTPEFPRSKYLENPDVRLNNYDFIIIMTATGFTEDDLWLYEEMTKRKKPVFLVRTKVLFDAGNLKEKTRKYEKKTIEIIIDELRKQYIGEMRGRKSPDTEELPDAEDLSYTKKLPDSVPVYFIDNHVPEHPNLDFSILIKAIIEKAPIAKKEAILYSLSINSSVLIEEKVKYLNERRRYVALFSGAAALTPVPGISAGIDMGLIDEELAFYKKQLGFDEARAYDISTMKIIKCWNAVGIDIVKFVVLSEGAESLAKVAFPWLGSIIASFVSAGTTYFILGKLLQHMKDDALKLNNAIFEIYDKQIRSQTGM